MKLTFSPLVSDARGKAGSAVFSSWKGQPYVRSHVIPANPNSVGQQAVRNAMSRLNVLWFSANSELKGAWDYRVSSRSLRMSGFNQFIKTNHSKEKAGTILTVTPPLRDVPWFQFLGISSGSGSGEIEVSWDTALYTGTHQMKLIIRKSGTNQFEVPTYVPATMADGSATITGLTGGEDYDVFGYVKDPVSGLCGESNGELAVTATV